MSHYFVVPENVLCIALGYSIFFKNIHIFLDVSLLINGPHWLLFYFSALDDASDVAAPEVSDSDLPPAHCEEEENNPYDGERWEPLIFCPT